MSREAMQQALEALEQLDGIDTETECVTIDVNDAITALRQALETKQEPVAHVYLFDKAGRPLVAWDNAKDIKLGDKLYVVKEKNT